MANDAILRKITIHPEDREFNSHEHETILDAALREGVQIPFSCRGGTCGACKVQLLEGDIVYGDTGPESLSEEEINTGWILCCQAQARSELVLKAREVTETRDLPIKTLPVRVMRMQQLSHDVMGMWLKLPSTERLQFLAGQYIDILLKDGQKRSFSLANAPSDDEFLQLQIRYYEGGLFSELVFKGKKAMTLLRIKGPYGHFFLRDQGDRHVVFVAGGTGFAPIKAIIEEMIAVGDKRPVSLYWGARAKRDLYLDELARSWAEEHQQIRYIPVLSEPLEEDQWQGQSGFVHDAVLQEISDFSDVEVYASGPPIMVQSVYQSFTECGLLEERFFADAFEFAASSS